MGARISRLVERIRGEKGPFFIARLCLRMDFAIDDVNMPDDPAKEQAIAAACRELGYDLDAPPIKRPPPR
jgi:hypothetical protein